MAGILDVPKPRINVSMLSQHVSRPVCFVGRVEKVSEALNVVLMFVVLFCTVTKHGLLLRQVHPTGKTFTVADGEGKVATVELNEPVSDSVKSRYIYNHS